MKNFNITLSGLVFEGAATNDPANGDRLYNAICDKNVTGYVHYELPIPNGTSNQAFTLPANPSSYLLIFTDQAISINLNGDSTPVILSPLAAGFKTFVYMLSGSITSLTVSNSSGTLANVDVVLANH